MFHGCFIGKRKHFQDGIVKSRIIKHWYDVLWRTNIYWMSHFGHMRHLRNSWGWNSVRNEERHLQNRKKCSFRTELKWNVSSGVPFFTFWTQPAHPEAKERMRCSNSCDSSLMKSCNLRGAVTGWSFPSTLDWRPMDLPQHQHRCRHHHGILLLLLFFFFFFSSCLFLLLFFLFLLMGLSPFSAQLHFLFLLSFTLLFCLNVKAQLVPGPPLLVLPSGYVNSLLLKITIEIVDFPMKNGGSFHSYVAVYQRVSPKNQRLRNWVSDKLPMRRPPDSIHRLRSASRSPVLCWSPLLFWIPVIGVLWCFFMDVYERCFNEGSLEVKLPTMTDGKAEVGQVREKKGRRKKIREEKESEERRCRCAKR